MTDDSKNKQSDDELVLDWDDAVDSWGQGLDRSAKAEAAPFPTQVEVDPLTSLVPGPLGSATLPPGGLATDPAPPPVPTLPPVPSLPPLSSLRPAPSPAPVESVATEPAAEPAAEPERVRVPPHGEAERPRMYRPPTAQEIASMAPTQTQTQTKTSVPPAFEAESWEDDSDRTQIASIPRELIESLARADANERDLNVRGISVVSRDEDSVSISIDDADLESSEPPPTGDASPAPEGSGVFGPPSVRPRADKPGVSEPPLIETFSEPPMDVDDQDVDEDATRVLDFNVEDFVPAEPTRRSRPPTPPPLVMPLERVSSAPPTAATRSSVPSPQPRQEVSVLQNLDELAPPTEAPRVSTPPASLPPSEDRGAATALRTVHTRKPRHEHLPLVAPDAAGKKARIELLLALGTAANEVDRAALLVQAAELAEELEDVARARALYEKAIESHGECVAAFEALARLALEAEDYGAYATRLETLAALPVDRRLKARALSTSSLVRWLVDGDQPAALRAAAEAERLDPDNLSLLSLLARIEVVSTPRSADVTLAKLAERVQDAQLRAAVLAMAGRAQELRGAHAPALGSYRAAAESDAMCLEARLGEARMAHRLKHDEDAARALKGILEIVDVGPVAEAVRRQAACLMARKPERRAEAVQSLVDSTDMASLRTAAQITLAAGDRATAERVVRAWTTASHGTDRALAYVTLAELESERGDATAAEEALSAAQRAAPDLALVPVVREVLARRRGDARMLAQVAADDELSQGPLVAAATLAADPANVEQELSWLSRAEQASVELPCTESLLLDAGAEAGDHERVRSVLRAMAERSAPHVKAVVLLTLAELDKRHDAELDAHKELADAIDLDPRSTVLLRAYVRAQPPATEVARAFEREAEATTGVRAAFAHLRAGYALADDHEARLAAFAGAYDAAPSYAPAVWALHHESRRQGDLERLQDLHAREAGRSRDALTTVAHLVRAALVRAGADTDGAAAQLARGLDLMPNDPVLRELVIRLGDAVPATLRAEAIQRMAEHAPPGLERPALLAAAGAFEDAHQPARAAQLYETVLAREPHDPIADMGLERVALSAGKADELLRAKHEALATAVTPPARLKALEDLLGLDETATPETTLERAHAILELDPTHRTALRQLERKAMQDGDPALLLDVEKRLLAVSRGGRDKTSRLRLISVLLQLAEEASGWPEGLDQLVLGPGRDAEDGTWLARQLMGSAIPHGDDEALVRAFDLLLDRTSDPVEKLTLLVERAQLVMHRESHLLEHVLGDALEKHPDHPLASEVLSQVRREAGDVRGAAEALERAAQAAQHPSRKARLWYEAGVLWQEELRAPDRARTAFRHAAESDIAYADVQARLEGLLSGRNDVDGLVQLTEARIRAGGTPEQIAELHRHLAKLQEKRGDRAEALRSLKAAQAAAPDNLAVLRDFAKACEAEGDHRESAEALIRLARLSRDPVELREAFFRLGEIYDLHLPDPRRAEAAYRRVLKLGPRHVKALERLAALYKREGQHDLAVEALDRLLSAVESTARKREVAFELAKLKEEHGDLRGAEESLEQLRKTSPTDLYVLRGLADFYRRQNAHSALAMHLNRAVNDLRHAVEADYDDAALWTALVEMLDERPRRDAARACASAAFALGLADASVVTHTDNEGNVPGVGGAAFSELLDDLVFPEDIPPSVRIVFRYGAEALNKAAPFDVRLLGGEKLDKKHPLRGIVQEMARWVGVSDAEVYVTSQLPYAFVPVSDAPLALLVGKTLLEASTRGEQQFLVARALKIAKAQMSITCRIRPEEMALMIEGLIRSQAPDYAAPGGDAAALDEMSRRIGRHVSKRAREDLLPHLVELAGATEFDPTRVYAVASTAGNRAGLLATGSAPSALSALAKLAGLGLERRVDAAVVAQVEEAKELLTFTISEAHFEARQRAGADRL